MEPNTKPDAFSKVLQDEIEMLRPQARDPQQSLETCADRAQLMGLALSGGGIRSATFCLGIIQALARLRLLRAFDYLSTVSGGGYIGAWLSALIHRTRKPDQPVMDALAAVELELAGEQRPWCQDDTPASDCPPEPPSLRFLRRYSNYLTPKLGILSGDSLAAVSTYVRNLLLNQLILVAFFGAFLTLPYLALSLGRWLIGPVSNTQMDTTKLAWLYGLAIVPMFIAVSACALSLMRFHKVDRLNLTGPRGIVGWIVVPSLIAAWALALAMRAHAEGASYTLWQWVWVTALVYLLPWFFAFWVKLNGTDIAMTATKKVVPVFTYRNDPDRLPAAQKELNTWLASLASFCVSFAWQIPWTLLAGALGGVLFFGLREGAAKLPQLGGIEYATAFGTPLALLSFAAVVTLHVGLMKRLFQDNDREWWARLGGFILLAAVAWTGVFAVTLYAAPLVKWLTGLVLAAGGLAWIASSVGGVLLGKSSLTGPQGKVWLNRLALAAPYVFIIGLTIVLASVLNWVLTTDELCKNCDPLTAGKYFAPILDDALANFGKDKVSMPSELLVAGGCMAVFFVLGWRVDINLFSLHGFYRNRLTRCYLGATRVGETMPRKIERDPHPFTGFDPADDLPLSKLADQRPYPIINAAMNLTGGDDLAWQTRRAASFAFTPCHTGFEFWTSIGERVSAYRCTEEYAARQSVFFDAPGGILLGNVIAASGAAANPNMGYHTSTALSVLMSVFNVRLGRWCGNPLNPTTWRQASPSFGGLTLISEVFGRMTGHARFLNISDGGHFENLGIYELVRRRCRIVVAVDAGCDPDYQFEDLANTIRKCWTDFGTRIEINLAALRPQGKDKHIKSHFAVGCINYPNAPQPGVLIYIKASLSGDEPSDVREYADCHRRFPHESTGDQFFDENQFESYRELGRHIGLKVFAPLFSPLTNTSAHQMTPEQIRDALPDRLPDHPALQAIEWRAPPEIRPHQVSQTAAESTLSPHPQPPDRSGRRE